MTAGRYHRSVSRGAHIIAGCCLGLLLLARVAAAQPQDAPPEAAPPPEAVVARVNGVPIITVAQFKASYVQALIQSGANDTPALRHTHLQELIDAHLLAEEARRRGMEQAADYQAFVDRRLKAAVGGRYFELAFADSLPPLTDEEVRAAFVKSQQQVLVRHLLYRDEAEAARAYARLQAGEDFVALANACFGTAAFDSTAGLLGLAGYWDLDDAFAELAFSLPVGQASEPVRTRYGWHLIRVEEKIMNPLLTESEYQYRREGLRQKAHARRFRLQGDRFIRSFMEGLDVTVEREGMTALYLTVQEATGDDTDPAGTPRTRIDAEEVAAIRAELTPETLLATYTLAGRPHAFTAQDYYGWLEDLPYDEIRHRTAASVGRALRNEALALQGFALGLDRDSTVLARVRQEADLYLADALRRVLRTDTTHTPTEAALREAYERVGFDRLREAPADFWHLRFATSAEAEAAHRALAAQERTPADYATYVQGEGQDLLQLDELGDHLRRAPLNTPVLIGTGDGSWYVAEVTARDLVYTPFEAVRDQLARLMRPLLPERALRHALRRNAQIEVDTTLFEAMMQLDA